jgi:hypothetical protein
MTTIKKHQRMREFRVAKNLKPKLSREEIEAAIKRFQAAGGLIVQLKPGVGELK